MSPTSDRKNSRDGDEAAEARDSVPDNSNVPKPKRLACMICRKRKLKCDGMRPSCSTCSRLGHDCAYDEQRRKSGPKRGYVKALEERLKQVETLLKTQDPTPASSAAPAGMNMPTNTSNGNAPQNGAVNGNGSLMPGERDWNYNAESPRAPAMDEFGNFNANMGMPMNNVGGGNFTWEMIGLGLEEPLPPQETIDELHQIYFDKVHPSMPMIHRYRYMAAMNLAPNQRPPVCLRYAMWTMACSITDKYSDLKDLFYQRARKYVEADYVRGYGEHMISVAHCQTHILLASYEMKMMYFPRAWINTGSAVRLSQMIGLHRVDGTGLEVKQCLQPARDWTEQEERRRTFWMAFCEDRYASIGTGWPMTVDERDIMTNLPCSEDAFNMSRPEQTQTLEECTQQGGAAKLSSFGGIVLMACLFGRNLVHLHRPDDDDQDHDTNGPFWKRHRSMDHILLDTTLSLPAHLKLPSGLANPNVVFTNMSIHTSTICLHQAAIFKAEKNKLPASTSTESKVRCISAANEIASIMRTVSHMDLSAMNPFIAFCLYVSARVFVQYLKSKPDDDKTADSLRFLLSAMNALKKRNPLTESFLVQLEVDFEALAQKIPKLRNSFPRGDGDKSEGQLCTDPDSMKGIFSYRRETQYANSEDDHSPRDGSEEKPGAVNASAYGQTWLSAEGQMPVLTPSSGSMYDRNGGPSSGQVSGIGEANGERDGLESPGGPTPKSSSSGGDGRNHYVTGQMNNGSGLNGMPNVTAGDGYRTSLSPSQPMAGATPFRSQGPGFFPVGGAAFGLQQQQQPQMPNQNQNGAYSMPNGWTEMGAGGRPQTEPMQEGVLRALMTMSPMDAMDLSSWDSNNEPMRG